MGQSESTKRTLAGFEAFKRDKEKWEISGSARNRPGSAGSISARDLQRVSSPPVHERTQ
jgi:hypothetical protein